MVFQKMFALLITVSIFILGLIIWTVFLILGLKGKINPHKFFHNDLYTDFDYNPVPDKEMGKVVRGREKASKSRIIITGLTRDNEERIAKNLDNLVKIGRNFDDYRIIIYENDSKDKTRDIIEELSSKNSKIELIQCEEEPRCRLGNAVGYSDGLFSKPRIERMSLYRNKYLKYIDKKYGDWDYLFVCDLDMEGIFFETGFLHALQLTSDYSGVFANGLFSVPGLGMVVPYDGMAYSKSMGSKEKGIVSNFCSQVKTCMGKHEPIEVDSAFNGGGIYVMKDIKSLYYTAEYSCEHNSFNYSLRSKNCKLCIDPFFLVYAGMQGHF